jgi:secretion/DNA translocation related CpaE-like protein
VFRALSRAWLSYVSGVVIGVVGGSGGVGASTFASLVAVGARGAMLIDLDPVGGGIDVLLGVEDLPGARWSGLRVDGGYLDPALLADGLPRWRDVAVLAADVPPPGPAATAQVIAAAAGRGPLVLDLPRAPSPVRDAALAQCAVCVLVAAAEIRAIVAASAVLRTLAGVRVGVVLRRAGMAAAEALALLDVPLIGVLPSAERPSRASARVANGVLDGLVA